MATKQNIDSGPSSAIGRRYPRKRSRYSTESAVSPVKPDEWPQSPFLSICRVAFSLHRPSALAPGSCDPTDAGRFTGWLGTRSAATAQSGRSHLIQIPGLRSPHRSDRTDSLAPMGLPPAPLARVEMHMINGLCPDASSLGEATPFQGCEGSLLPKINQTRQNGCSAIDHRDYRGLCHLARRRSRNTHPPTDYASAHCQGVWRRRRVFGRRAGMFHVSVTRNLPAVEVPSLG
jgi:hypothetical protein